MNSLNTKKIATIAAGAAMIGAAFAAAAPVVDTAGVGNFAWFSNGEPQFKIAVGSMADSSDVVAAANLASTVAGLSYVESVVTEAGSSGSSGKVKLTVKAPSTGTISSTASEYAFTSYLEDNVDDNVDTTRNFTSSWGGTMATGTTQGVTGGNPKKLTNTDALLSLPNNGALSDFSKSTSEQQNLFVFAKTRYNKNDKVVRAEAVRVGFEAIFTDGIPDCLDTSTNLGSCTSSRQLASVNPHVYIFGNPHIVINATTSGTASIILAREAVARTNYQGGQSVTLPNGATIKVDAISKNPIGATSQYAASITLSAPGKADKSVTINSDSTFDEPDYGVYGKAATVFLGSNDVAIIPLTFFTDKFTLTDGSDVSIKSTTSKWRARIGTGTVDSSAAIKRLALETSRQTDVIKTGESYPVIDLSPQFNLKFNGMESVLMDTLKVEAVNDQSYRLNDTMNLQGDWVRVTSEQSNAFQIGGENENQVLLFVRNTTSLQGASGASGNASLSWPCTVYYYDDDVKNYTYVGAVTSAAVATANTYGNLTVTTLDYYYDGINRATLQCNSAYTNTTLAAGTNVVGFQTGSSNSSTSLWLNLTIPEATIRDHATNPILQSTSANRGYWNLTYNVGDRKFEGAASATTYEEVKYADVDNAGNANLNDTFKAGYVSPRGSVLDSVSTTGVTIKYAKSVARALYSISKDSTVGTVVLPGSTVEVTPGQTTLVDGVNITIDAGATVPGSKTVRPRNVGNLVCLDAQCGSQPLVVVGGPFVNSVAASMGTADELGIGAAGQSVVKVVGNKVLVAGYTAQDTRDAVDTLMSWLTTTYPVPQ